MSEKDFQDSEHDIPRPPDGYLRVSDIWKAVGAFVGFAGLILAANGAVDRLREFATSLVQNERNERINQDNRFDQKLDRCCERRR